MMTVLQILYLFQLFLDVYVIKDTMEKTAKGHTILVVLRPARTEEHAPKLAHMVFHVHVQKVGFFEYQICLYMCSFSTCNNRKC